jgi:hypothetical protein
MSLIKSNSTLIAFKTAYGSSLGSDKFYFLNYIQNINFEVVSNRLNNKFIGSQNIVNNQFVSPEVNLNISYLQQSDLYNEQIFGFKSTSDYSINLSSLVSVASSTYFNNSAFILFSDLESSDLIYQIKNSGFNTSMISISFGRLFLKSYAFSYKVNNHAVVSASFVSDSLKVANLLNSNSVYSIQNADETTSVISTSLADTFLSSTGLPAKNSLIYSMRNLSFSNTFSSTNNPGPTISTFLDGLIQSLDFSFQLNRDKIYSFADSSVDSTSPIYRGVILPIIGSLKISGISKNFTQGNISNIFTADNKFNMTLLVKSKDVDVITNSYTEILFEKITVERFNYSIDINGMLNYSIDCSFQVTAESGFKFKNYNSLNPNYTEVFASDFEMQTSDNFLPYAHV